MSRLSAPSAIDVPVGLKELLSSDDLDEVASSFARAHAVGVTFLDRRGDVLGSAGAPAPASIAAAVGDGTEAGPRTLADGGAGRVLAVPLVHDGERLGAVVLGPYRTGPAGAAGALHPELTDEHAERVARSITQILGVVVHNAYARHLTSTAHLASMDEAFQELREKNARLAVAIERMQEVDRLKTSFLATVSHELRTPLTSVIGYSEMLLEGLAGELADEQREYVRTILAKADQLLQLITGILDASLIESGQLRIQREPVIVQDLVRSVISSFTSRALKRRISMSGPLGEVPRALGDSSKIRQVIWNLVANAVKFTPEGGTVAVELGVGPLAPGDEAGPLGSPPPLAGAAARWGLRIVVRDSGIGISPEKQAHIFEPFFQVDSSSTREYGGTGLGLTLAKSYVEAHGGHIWVDSKLGAGSVFCVSLPAVAADLDAYLAASAP